MALQGCQSSPVRRQDLFLSLDRIFASRPCSTSWIPGCFSGVSLAQRLNGPPVICPKIQENATPVMTFIAKDCRSWGLLLLSIQSTIQFIHVKPTWYHLRNAAVWRTTQRYHRQSLGGHSNRFSALQWSTHLWIEQHLRVVSHHQHIGTVHPSNNPKTTDVSNEPINCWPCHFFPQSRRDYKMSSLTCWQGCGDTQNDHESFEGA